ncbi:MAG: FtsX-like permease family protein, partial [Muribaculaceae bacterium]|nr:FtsX-like permease family protein [Muribaculaceae bacterium]
SIGVLKALGAGDRQLQTLFLLLGMRLLLCGIAVADIISVALIVLQHSFHVLPLDPHNYYLDYVPVDMTWNIFLTVNLGAVVLGALAMLVPVKIISTVRPVQAISFE